MKRRRHSTGAGRTKREGRFLATGLVLLPLCCAGCPPPQEQEEGLDAPITFAWGDAPRQTHPSQALSRADVLKIGKEELTYWQTSDRYGWPGGLSLPALVYPAQEGGEYYLLFGYEDDRLGVAWHFTTSWEHRRVVYQRAGWKHPYGE